MKTKNVILGICALVFAVGSAFTSLRMEENYKIQVDKGGAGCPSLSMQCIDITSENACNSTGSNCFVTVSSSQLQTSPSNATARNATCQVLPNNSSTPVTSLVDNCITEVYQ